VARAYFNAAGSGETPGKDGFSSHLIAVWQLLIATDGDFVGSKDAVRSSAGIRERMDARCLRISVNMAIGTGHFHGGASGCAPPWSGALTGEGCGFRSRDRNETRRPTGHTQRNDALVEVPQPWIRDPSAATEVRA
jgi:hypothetical protein